MSAATPRTWLGAVLAVAVVSLAWPAHTHPLAPSLLELREAAPGQIAVLWKTPVIQTAGARLEPQLPARCIPIGEPLVSRDAASAALRWQVDCGATGIVGSRLRVNGLEDSRTDAIVRIELSDGRRVRAMLSAARPDFIIPEREDFRAVVAEYATLGVQHILGGIDHLLFVLGLVLLAGTRRLVAVVTAFTLGHSVTLSLAALGYVGFPSALAELGIAASIFWLACELARGAGPSSRTWAMACGFGLLHGLGFAGALAEIGLPADEILVGLAAFNVGIELGQLLFVGAIVALGRLLRAVWIDPPAVLSRVPSYAIGSVAAYWCLDRAALLF